jgi:adenylosuccinate synthase
VVAGDPIRKKPHVHVTASPETCTTRFEERRARADVEETSTYEQVRADPTEAQVDSLGELADICIDTDLNAAEDVVVRAAAALGLLDREHAPCVDVVVGGGYGSEGKGNIAFQLAPEYDLLVRVGGPNAAHKVYLASGEIFTHFSLPSGTQNSPGAKLLLVRARSCSRTSL